MRIGFHLTPFWSPADRGATRILDEAIQVVAATARMGYAWVSIGQHWVSYPTVWPQPFPVLARLAPETGAMRLKTSVLLLPILNPVEVAENVATLDHLCHGRLDVGVAIGYREKELEIAGQSRSDRVAKLEESLALMKRLWAGEEVTFDGRYTRENMDRDVLPGVLWDAPEMSRSLAQLRELRDRKGATLVYGHDPGQWQDLRRAPEAFA